MRSPLWACGASLAELGDQEKSHIYGHKFQKLGSEVEKLFEQNEIGKVKARNLMLKCADEILDLTLIDRSIIPELVEICDGGLQSFQGLNLVD